MGDWYACYILANTEDKIKRALLRDERLKDIRFEYPKEVCISIVNGKKKTTIKPLFPNYAFIYIENTNQSIFTVLIEKTLIIKVLKVDNTPVPIENSWVEKYLNDYNSHNNRMRYMGRKVVIKSGTYSGIYGVVKALVKGTTELSVELEIGSLKVLKKIPLDNINFIEQDELETYEEID